MKTRGGLGLDSLGKDSLKKEEGDNMNGGGGGGGWDSLGRSFRRGRQSFSPDRGDGTIGGL